MLLAIKNRLISLFQLLLVIIYIIFEELIWEGIAKPIYLYVHSLEILQKVESRLEKSNRYVILSLFLLMFVLVEVAGIYAGILFVGGQILFGLLLYISKIPITAFTFWLFRVTEEKLMSFDWFKWLYEKMMAGIEWLKSREMYIKTMERLKVLKVSIKEWFKSFKEKYFAHRSPFMEKLKRLYVTLKDSLKK